MRPGRAKRLGNWKTAWTRARRIAGLRLRWHDLRHTFITRLAENPHVSEETIRSLAGHVSKEMLSRYSHVQTARNSKRSRASKVATPYKNRHTPTASPTLPRLQPRDIIERAR